jgi:hypothetical protein
VCCAASLRASSWLAHGNQDACNLQVALLAQPRPMARIPHVVCLYDTADGRVALAVGSSHCDSAGSGAGACWGRPGPDRVAPAQPAAGCLVRFPWELRMACARACAVQDAGVAGHTVGSWQHHLGQA